MESQVADLNKQTFISSVKDMADIGQAAATIIAAFVAGGWSLWLFKKYRRRYPRATIVHHITHRDIGNDKLLLHVNITISNVGDVLLSLISLETRIQQVLPLPDEVLDFINRGENPVPEGQTQIEWPLIDSQNLKLEKGECEIEPGESQEIHHDFILDAEVKTIEVYSYLVNEQKPDRELTWDVTTLYDLENTGEASSHPERSEPDGHRARANTETEEAKT